MPRIMSRLSFDGLDVYEGDLASRESGEISKLNGCVTEKPRKYSSLIQSPWP